MRTAPLLLTQAALAAAAGYGGYRLAAVQSVAPTQSAIVVPDGQAAVAPHGRAAAGGAAPAEAPAAPSASVGGAPVLSFRAAVERAAPSVVTVYSARRARGAEASQGLGSGVVLDASGLVVTNNHVVEGASQLAVALVDGSIKRARIVGTDPETDLALLAVEASGLKPIVLGDTSRIAVGDVVLAVGNPVGIGQTVTQGIVSATGRKRLGINPIENFVQTDAAINPGNSGGALIDTEGRLIGINTAILSRGGGSEGIGFAIPVELAQQVVESLSKNGRVSRGWLGVAAEDVGPNEQGVLITAVQRGGPAARAGLRAGDVVLRIGERPIRSADDLVDATLELEPGGRVDMQLRRGGRTITIPVELGRRPALRQSGAGGR